MLVTVIAEDLQLGGICHYLKGREISIKEFICHFSLPLFGYQKEAERGYIYQIDIDYLANHGIIICNGCVALASDYLRKTSRTIHSLKLSIEDLNTGVKDLQALEYEESEEEEGEEEDENQTNDKEFQKIIEKEVETEKKEQPKKKHVKTTAFKKVEHLLGREEPKIGKKRGPMSEEKKRIANKKRKANKRAKLLKITSDDTVEPKTPLLLLTEEEEEAFKDPLPPKDYQYEQNRAEIQLVANTYISENL